MPLSKALIAASALGFGFVVAAGPAFAANSQPRKLCPTNTVLAKGGTSHMHKKSGSESSSDLEGRAPDANESTQASGWFAAIPDSARSAEQHH